MNAVGSLSQRHFVAEENADRNREYTPYRVSTIVWTITSWVKSRPDWYRFTRNGTESPSYTTVHVNDIDGGSQELLIRPGAPAAVRTVLSASSRTLSLRLASAGTVQVGVGTTTGCSATGTPRSANGSRTASHPATTAREPPPTTARPTVIHTTTRRPGTTGRARTCR